MRHLHASFHRGRLGPSLGRVARGPVDALLWRERVCLAQRYLPFLNRHLVVIKRGLVSECPLRDAVNLRQNSLGFVHVDLGQPLQFRVDLATVPVRRRNLAVRSLVAESDVEVCIRKGSHLVDRFLEFILRLLC